MRRRLSRDVGAPLPVAVADRDHVALVSFRRVYAVFFGPPNDEAFDGHPLAAHGLEPYGAFEVEHSSWIREEFDALRHFAFTFHDSMFEVLAHGFDVTLTVDSLAGALQAMAARLTRGA